MDQQALQRLLVECYGAEFVLMRLVLQQILFVEMVCQTDQKHVMIEIRIMQIDVIQVVKLLITPSLGMVIEDDDILLLFIRDNIIKHYEVCRLVQRKYDLYLIDGIQLLVDDRKLQQVR
jgi:hypothetical protein